MRRVWLPAAAGVGVLLIVSFSKGTGPICRNGPKGAAHKLDLSPFASLAEADDPAAEAGDDDETNPLGANAACYVCHIPFVKEELSRVHLKAKVACIKCHGLSAGHVNDEDVGATPPEVVFKRKQIDSMCVECHKGHDVPAREVIARWLQRRPSAESPAVCTDCHGTHKIERPADTK